MLQAGTQKVFCVHGGLSPSLQNITDLENIQRGQEVPHDGLVSDILWSDPSDQPDQKGYQQSQRGAGYFFGQDVVEQFCKHNGLEFVCRSHQLAMEGYRW